MKKKTKTDKLLNPIFKVVLPWPDRELNPNVHSHWAKKRAAGKSARQDALYCAREQYSPEELEHAIKEDKEYISLRLFFPPQDKYERDVDNLAAMMKHYQDGIFDAFNLYDQQTQEGDPKRFDDKQVKDTINRIIEDTEQPARVVYYLLEQSKAVWITKIPLLIEGQHT